MSSQFTIDGLVYTQTSSEEVSVKQETCSNSSYTIPESVPNNGKTFKVTSIACQGFVNCRNITKVDLPSSIRVFEYDAFARTGLEYEEFAIPENTEKIDSYIFANTRIKKLKINKNLVSIAKNPIVDSSISTYYDVASENPKYSNDEQGILYDKIKTEIIAVPNTLVSFMIPDTVVSIRSFAINSCIAKKIEFPQSVHVFSGSAFYYGSYESIIIKGNIMKGTKIFNAYPNLKNITYYGYKEVRESVLSITKEIEVFVCSQYRGKKFGNIENITRTGQCIIENHLCTRCNKLRRQQANFLFFIIMLIC